MDELIFSARVVSRENGGAKAHIRKHSFEIGAPLSFDSEYDGITAIEQVLGSFGGDLVCGLLYRAKKKRVDISSAEVLVEASLNNPLSYLDVVGEIGNTAIKSIKARVYIISLAAESELQTLWQEVLARSPLVNTFSAAVTLNISMKIQL